MEKIVPSSIFALDLAVGGLISSCTLQSCKMLFKQTKQQTLHQVSSFHLIVFILLCGEVLCIELNNYRNGLLAAQIMKAEV